MDCGRADQLADPFTDRGHRRMEAALRLGSFAQAACHRAPATDQARATVAQGEKALNRARRIGVVEYWSIGEMGVGKVLLTYPSPHYSTTPLLPSPQFRGLIFPAQTTPSPHEKLFSLRRSVRLPKRRAGARILGAARPHPRPSALGPLCFVRGRIRCDDCRPGAVPYGGPTPPLELRRDPKQTLLNFFRASTPSHRALPSRRDRAVRALANAIQCPRVRSRK